jgi:hypothetical protein
MTIADVLSDAKDEIAEYQASGNYDGLETELQPWCSRSTGSLSGWKPVRWMPLGC